MTVGEDDKTGREAGPSEAALIGRAAPDDKENEMAKVTYYSDISREPVALSAIHGMDNAQFGARWPGLRGKRFDGYQMLVGRSADGQTMPVTRCVFRKTNPSNHKCSARCLNAKCTGRGECECECGGRNHGRGMFTGLLVAA